MSLRLYFVSGLSACGLCLLPACATVDMSGIASPELAVSETPAIENPLITAAEALSTFYAAKGWVYSESGQADASGLRIFTGHTGKADPIVTADTADLRAAAQQILSVSETAKTYLADSKYTARLDDELTALEKALSRSSSVRLRLTPVSHLAGHAEFETALADLGAVTNAYGDHVRASISAAAQGPQG